jgi:hypothetical protein
MIAFPAFLSWTASSQLVNVGIWGKVSLRRRCRTLRNHPPVFNDVQMCASTDEEEHVVHGPQPLVNAGKSLYCVRDLQRLQVCRTLRINMRSKWQVINWQNGRSYLLSKKDHGGDRKSDGYIIESSCQLDNLIEPKTEEINTL